MRTGSYDLDEVTTLVEEFLELNGSSRAFIRVRLMDLDRSVPRLTLPLRQAVVLHGMYGLSIREVGRLAGVEGSTILRRYRNGLEQLLHTMNGG